MRLREEMKGRFAMIRLCAGTVSLDKDAGHRKEPRCTLSKDTGLLKVRKQ
jgi:hypothetical protein